MWILSTSTTTVQYVFQDTWFLVSTESVLDFGLLQRDVTGNFTSKPAVQFAPVRPEGPGSPAAIANGSYTAAVGWTPFHETAFVTNGQAWCRTGVAYKLSASGALGTGQVSLQPYLHGCVEAVGGVEVAINPGQVGGTDENYVAQSGWVPAAGLTGVMVGLGVEDNLSTYLENQVVVRSCVDPRSPNAWQLAEAAWSNPSSGNSERNTGELAIPSACNLTSNTLAQVGMVWRKKSGAAGNPRATLAPLVVVLRG